MSVGPSDVCVMRLAGTEKSEAPFAQFAGDVAEERRGIGIPHVMGIAARREVHAHAVRAPHRDHRIGHL